MSKAAGIIGKIAAVVALVAGIALLFVPGGQVFGVALIKIAAVASAVSAVANAVSMATMKPPDAQGSVNQVLIGKNLPVPLALGRTICGGLQVYDKAGNGPDNYDRTMIQVCTAGGPIEGFEAFQFNYSTINFVGSDWNTSRKASGFYGQDGGYLWLNTRKGLQSETALTPFAGRAAFTEWGASHKMSGYAAYSITMEFDEDGVRWGAGVPQPGMIAKWVKNYDPRKDSTYPGGSGPQRWDDQSTWEFGTDGSGTVAQGENPGLQALAYIRGYLSNGVRVVGCGLPKESIRIAQFVELANLCDANGWKGGGVLLDGPGINRWDNIKRILQAAAAEPVWAGGMLGLNICAPKTPVFTITPDSLADGDVEIRAMQSWRDRVNTIVPKVRLETHRWEYEQLEAVTSSVYLAEDGEDKTKEVQFDLVQDADQGAQLGAYALVNGREFGPITVTLKPEYMVYQPGEAATIDLTELGLDGQLAVIRSTSVDPGTGVVQMVLVSETTDKHAFALGQTGIAPPTPTIVPAEEVDEAVAGNTTVPPDPASITVVSWTDRLMVRTDPVSRASSYRWRFYLADGTTLKRELITAVPQAEYTRAQAHADGVSRDYKVQVAAQNAIGTGNALMSGTLSNTAPAAPTGVAFADGTSTSTVSGTASVSSDVSAYLVAYSTNSGFNPLTEGQSFFCTGFPAYTGQLPAATYYGKVAAVDLWTSQPDQVNFSAQDTFVITPGGGGSPAPGGGGGGASGGGGGGIIEQ